MRRGGVDESRSETVLRRLRTILPLVLGLLLVTALLPALLVVGLAIDLGRWAVSRVPPTATPGCATSPGACRRPGRQRCSGQCGRCSASESR